jgi:hypothetical protein
MQLTNSTVLKWILVAVLSRSSHIVFIRKPTGRGELLDRALAAPGAGPQLRNRMMKLATIALASAFALASTFALAKTVRHKPSVRTYDLHRGIPQVSDASITVGCVGCLLSYTAAT